MKVKLIYRRQEKEFIVEDKEPDKIVQLALDIFDKGEGMPSQIIIDNEVIWTNDPVKFIRQSLVSLKSSIHTYRQPGLFK